MGKLIVLPPPPSSDIALQRRTKPLVTPSPPIPKTGTPEVMECIREVIKNTSTPSWLHSVPYNFGASQAGTLTADEWRSMASVYLPLALVKLWGHATPATSQDAGHFQDVLVHSMALFSAVRLACLHTMTHERQEAYRANMIQYISGLSLELYRTSDPRPNHHMALHIYDFLKIFGPVRGWWCFPFERLIGLLQRQPINHKFGKSISETIMITLANLSSGELESTMHRSFIRAGRLKSWLARSDCPPGIRECKIIFDKLTPDVYDTHTEQSVPHPASEI